jgi:quercetin 2,3-dioxygenase
MVSTRRSFLVQTSALAAAGVLGCRGTSAPPTPAVIQTRHRRVAQTFAGMPTTDGAGVKLLRVIGQPAIRNLDPFLMLDRLFSDDPSAYIRGFPDHPHRGFETVSIMLDGRIRHKDSRGNQGLITGGGAQWMTAGRGIVHSEMPEQDRGLLSGFQLWINLPASEKLCTPFYQDLGPEKLVEDRLSPAGSVARIIAGASHRGAPVRPRPTEPTLLTLLLEDDRPFELDLPEGHTAFAFVHTGAATLGPENDATRIAAGTLAVLGDGRALRVQARDERAGLLIAAARPLHEPIVQRGPFVMNTEAEIQKAFADYRAGVLDRS